MIMQEISLYDEVHISKNDEKSINFEIDKDFLPSDINNIAFQAGEIMRKKFGIETGLDIKVVKNIPVAAGLAGGSTDAAGVIKGINDLFDLKLSLKEMMEIGLEIGADVPFCIMGGCALAEGLGEKLSPISNNTDLFILLSKPEKGVSTELIYKSLNYKEILIHPDTNGMIKSLEYGNVDHVASKLCNVMENVTEKLVEDIPKIKAMMKENNALNTLMSGSGPSVFGIFENRKDLENAYSQLKSKYNETFIVTKVSRK